MEKSKINLGEILFWLLIFILLTIGVYTLFFYTEKNISIEGNVAGFLCLLKTMACFKPCPLEGREAYCFYDK